MFSRPLTTPCIVKDVSSKSGKDGHPAKQPLYRKCMWSDKEDDLLRRAVERYGTKNWSMISSMVPGRNGKQCRERWSGMLSPDLAREAWSLDEDRLLIQLHSEYGNKWAKISEFLPGRSRISLRNRWGWHVRHRFSLAGLSVPTPVSEPGDKGNEVSTSDVKVSGDVFDSLDKWTGEIERDLWMEIEQPWFA